MDIKFAQSAIVMPSGTLLKVMKKSYLYSHEIVFYSSTFAQYYQWDNFAQLLKYYQRVPFLIRCAQGTFQQFF